MNKRAALALVAVLLMAACSGGGDDQAQSSSTAATSDASSSSSLQLGPGQLVHKVDAAFEYGAFIVRIGAVVYDKDAQTLFMGMSFTNLASEWGQPVLAGALSVDGDDHPVIADAPLDVPPGTTANATLSVPSVDKDPVPAGVLAWGDTDTDQPKVKLDGKLANAWLPAPVALDGWAQIGKYAVHVNGAQVQSGFLNLNQQADPGQRVLRVDFDDYADTQDPVNGFYPAEHLTLKHPDGQIVEAVDASTGRAPVSWTVGTGEWIELPIDASVDGDYQLLLSSISTKAFSLEHPELIERTSLDLHLQGVKPGSVPQGTWPVPTLPATTGGDTGGATSGGFETDLDVGTLNVPGMSFRPTHLSWDASGQTAKLEGDATVLERDDSNLPPATDEAGSAAEAAGGLLDVTPTFAFTVLLVSGDDRYNGTVAGDPTVPRGAPTHITIEFDSVVRLDPDTVGVYIGNRSYAASSMPLGKSSPVALYPPTPDQQPIAAAPAAAGEWSIQLLTYRVGMLLIAPLAPAGQRQLEVTMDVTAAPDAQQKILGLSFRPSVQVFIAGADGYMTQAVADSGLVFFNPGETHRESVTFLVPDSFQPRQLSFVLRSADETADVTTEAWAETTFGAVLGTAASTKAGAGQ